MGCPKKINASNAASLTTSNVITATRQRWRRQVQTDPLPAPQQRRSRVRRNRKPANQGRPYLDIRPRPPIDGNAQPTSLTVPSDPNRGQDTNCCEDSQPGEDGPHSEGLRILSSMDQDRVDGSYDDGIPPPVDFHPEDGYQSLDGIYLNDQLYLGQHLLSPTATTTNQAQELCGSSNAPLVVVPDENLPRRRLRVAPALSSLEIYNLSYYPFMVQTAAGASEAVFAFVDVRASRSVVSEPLRRLLNAPLIPLTPAMRGHPVNTPIGPVWPRYFTRLTIRSRKYGIPRISINVIVVKDQGGGMVDLFLGRAVFENLRKRNNPVRVLHLDQGQVDRANGNGNSLAANGGVAGDYGGLLALSSCSWPGTDVDHLETDVWSPPTEPHYQAGQPAGMPNVSSLGVTCNYPTVMATNPGSTSLISTPSSLVATPTFTEQQGIPSTISTLYSAVPPALWPYYAKAPQDEALPFQQLSTAESSRDASIDPRLLAAPTTQR
jgi:hypothetical protein